MSGFNLNINNHNLVLLKYKTNGSKINIMIQRNNNHNIAQFAQYYYLCSKCKLYFYFNTLENEYLVVTFSQDRVIRKYELDYLTCEEVIIKNIIE